ncbi:hypothetical protein GC173_05525 [bacterium]|nr:hypothetical protein [bacterium]
MEADPVVLVEFHNPYDAQMARVALESEGIPCQLLDQNQAGWTGIGVLFPVRLLVLPEDLDAAKELLTREGLYSFEE